MVDVRSGSFLRTCWPFIQQCDEGVTVATLLQETAESGPAWQQQPWDVTELVPAVADFLQGCEGVAPGAWRWELEAGWLRSFKGLGAQGAWTLTAGRSTVVLKPVAVSLIGFEVGVGLLQVDWQPVGDALEDWILARRLLTVPYATCAIERRTGRDTSESFVPGCLQTDAETFALQDLFGALLTSSSPTGQVWWDDDIGTGTTLGYGCLLVDGLDDAGVHDLAYRLQRGVGADQPVPQLNADAVDLLAIDQGLSMASSLEGVFFLGVDLPDSEYFTHQLPNQIRGIYASIYALILHQRFGLLHLHHRISRSWSQECDDLDEFGPQYAAFDALRRDVHRFVARGCFPDVCQRHVRFVFQHSLEEQYGLDRLTDRVYQELSEKAGYVQMQMDRQEQLEAERRTTLFAVLAIIIAVPSLLFGMFGVDVKNIGVGVQSFIIVAITLTALSVASIFVGWKLVSKRYKGLH